MPNRAKIQIKSLKDDVSFGNIREISPLGKNQ